MNGNETSPPLVAKWVLSYIEGFVATLVDAMQTRAEGTVGPLGWEIGKGITNELKEITAEKWQEMLQWFIDSDFLNKEIAAELYKLKDIGAPFNFLMFLMVTSSLLNQWRETVTYYSSAELRHNLASKYSPELPRIEQILQAAFTAPEKTAEVRELLKKSGLSDKHIDLAFLANYRLYNEETVRILWLRGVLSDDEMFMRMREMGYTDTRIKEISQSWPIIPGPTDLFHLVAREAFEPDAIKMMGLLDEFPAEQVKWLQQQGVSEDWAQKYWVAHWEQPPIGQGFEMLHRGVIGMEELDMLYRTVEIPPYWRDKLTAIAYMPYTRVDVRRMHDMGVLTDEELIKSYMDLGYDHEHAVKMSEFTKRYNQGAEKELTKSNIIQGYKDKLFSRTDAIELLAGIDYNADLAEYYLVTEDYKEAKDLQDDLIDNIRDRYQNNLIDFIEARRLLDNLNLPAVKRQSLLDKWEINVFKNRKLPSRGDLSKMLLQGIITVDEFRTEMDKLGYNFKYIEWYSKVDEAKRVKVVK